MLAILTRAHDGGDVVQWIQSVAIAVWCMIAGTLFGVGFYARASAIDRVTILDRAIKG